MSWLAQIRIFQTNQDTCQVCFLGLFKAQRRSFRHCTGTDISIDWFFLMDYLHALHFSAHTYLSSKIYNKEMIIKKTDVLIKKWTYSPQHLHGAAAVWRPPCVEIRFTLTFLGNQNETAYVCEVWSHIYQIFEVCNELNWPQINGRPGNSQKIQNLP